MGERINQIATVEDLSPEEELLLHHHEEEATSMEMNPGALQGADTGILVPRSLLAIAVEIGIASGEKVCGIRVSSTGVKLGPKGAPGEVPPLQEAW